MSADSRVQIRSPLHGGFVLEPLEGRRLLSVNIDANGWTRITPSSDSRMIYVSSSAGSDANSGRSPKHPVKTIARGESLLRDGMPDWLRLKKGDSWSETFGRWWWSGRSQQESVVIGSYGAGSRPLLRTGNRTGLSVYGGSGMPASVNNVAITDVAMKPTTYKGTTDTDGIFWDYGGQNLLIENVSIGGYRDGLNIQSNGSTLRNVQVRRSIITNAYHADSAHSQGIYIDGVRGVLIDGNVFYHNGWLNRAAPNAPTIFNHNVYIQDNNTGVVLTNNISLDASAQGISDRAGGVVENNFVAHSAIGISYLNGSGDLKNNVVLAGDARAGNLPGWGINIQNIQNALITGNAVSNVISGTQAYGLADTTGVSFTGNAAWNWPGSWYLNGNTRLTMGGNPTKRFPDPGRSIETYMISLGKSGTYAAFVRAELAQSKDNWNPQLATAVMNDYFRAGVGLPMLGRYRHGRP